MELFVVGTSHSLASASVRERLHVDVDDVFASVKDLLVEGVLLEALPLATCARLELYGVTEDPDRAARLLLRILASRVGVPRRDLEEHVYTLKGGTASRHLFRVASGLDSVVHGEAQILGQVREAVCHPLAESSKGRILHRLFEMSLATGKRVRSETDIGRGAASLASAAIAMVQQEMGSLESVSALILGAGDTGSLVARLLRKAGVGRLVVANRTVETAREVAETLGGEGIALSELDQRLGEADLVVGAVTASECIVTPQSLDSAISLDAASRNGDVRRRYFLDLAHPRNFDPVLEDRGDVRLFDLDHVFDRVQAAQDARASQVPRAEAIVTEQAALFERWMHSAHGVRMLRAVREQVLEIAGAEADRFAQGRTAEEREQMHRLARSLARTILHAPTMALRELDSESEEGRSLLAAAPALFGVEVEPIGSPGRTESGS